jgi:hypothetical protein
MTRDQMPVLGEVLFEFVYKGNVVRVSAIDPRTNTEVRMVGDPRLTDEALKAAAMRKLAYVMRRDGKLR